VLFEGWGGRPPHPSFSDFKGQSFIEGVCQWLEELEREVVAGRRRERAEVVRVVVRQLVPAGSAYAPLAEPSCPTSKGFPAFRKSALSAGR